MITYNIHRMDEVKKVRGVADLVRSGARLARAIADLAENIFCGI